MWPRLSALLTLCLERSTDELRHTGRGGRDYPAIKTRLRTVRSFPDHKREGEQMSEALVEKSCAPCRGGVPALTHEQAEEFRLQAREWNLLDDAHRIERKFRFGNFRDALNF